MRGALATVLTLAAMLSACDANGGVSSSDRSPAAGSSPAATPEVPAGPGRPAWVEGEARPFAIRLRWDGSSSGEVEEYRIYRNQTQVTAVAGSTTSYRDERVLPGRRYVYEIEAVAGGVASERARIRVKVPKPPLSAARLEGVFNIRARPTSSFGYTEEVRSHTMGWEFEPTCGSGPCRVRWSDTTFRDLKATLSRNGKTYRGSARARLNVRCGETTTFSSVEVEFRISNARAIGDAWRATRIQGRMERAEAAQLGCVASGATLTISGRLLAA